MAQRSSASLLRSVVGFSGSYVVAILGYLVLMASASRLVGAIDFAHFLVIMTVTGLVGQLGLLGVNRSGLREAARIDLTDLDSLADLRAGVRAISLTTLPAASLLTAGFAWLLVDGSMATQALVASLTFALVYLNGQQKLVSSYLRGLGRLRTANLLAGRSGGALVAVAQAAFTVGVWRLAPDTGLVGALAAVTLGFALPVIAASVELWLLWRRCPARPGLWSNMIFVARRDWKFAVTQVGGYANASADLWIAAAILAPLMASNFGAAQRLAQLLLIPSASLQVVFSPAISRMAAHPDRRRLQTLLRTGSSICTGATALPWLVMISVPALLMTTLFGNAFDDGAAVLVLLSTGYFMNALSGLSGITLSMSHFEGRVARVQWIGLVLRVAAGSVAAWEYGLVGLAVTSSITTVLIYALMWVQAWRFTGVLTHATLRPRFRLLGQVAG